MERMKIQYFIVIIAIFLNHSIYSANSNIVQYGIVTDDDLLVRNKIMGQAIDRLYKGDRVIIISRSNKKYLLRNHNNYWYKVKLANNIIGWTYGEWMRISPDLGESLKERLLWAVRFNSIEELKKILLRTNRIDFTYNNKTNILCEAASFSRLKIVELLINKGVNINYGDIDKWTPLMFAVKNNRLDIVEILLEKGVSVNTQNVNGTSALMIACLNGNEKIIDLLLKKGANINQKDNDGNSPFLYAAQSDKVYALSQLLSRRVDFNLLNSLNQNALIIAIKNKQFEATKLLLNSGIDTDVSDIYGNNALIYAAKNKLVFETNMLLKKHINVNHKNKKGLSAISYAIANNDRAIAFFLIKNGAYVDIMKPDGVNTFLWASRYGYQDIIKILLYQNVGLKILNDAMKLASENNHTETVEILRENGALEPLELNRLFINAIETGNLSKIKKMLEGGANINASNQWGDTTLAIAAWRGQFHVIDFLFSRGINVNEQATDGHTALTLSCFTGNAKLVELLLKKGADFRKRVYNGGQTALAIAKGMGHKEIVRLLRHYGATE